MQSSTAEAPFHFNFGAPGDPASATQAAAVAADQQSEPLSSVEVRPPYQVVHKSITFTAIATVLDLRRLTHHAYPHLLAAVTIITAGSSGADRRFVHAEGNL